MLEIINFIKNFFFKIVNLGLPNSDLLYYELRLKIKDINMRKFTI